MGDITRSEMAALIDQTNLRPDVTRQEMAAFVRQARAFGFCTVAIMTAWVPLASELLEGWPTSIVASVGFPLGTYPTRSKVAETQWALQVGRPDIEIDMVMNMALFKSRRYAEVEADMRAVVEAAEGRITKVIIEVPMLSQDEIVIAAQIAERAGVNFVKTSTGFRAYPQMRASTPADVALIRKALGARVRVKIAGGVFSLESALQAIDAGAARIGTVAGVPIVEAMGE